MTPARTELRAALQSFPVKVRRWLRPGFLPRPVQNVWQWAEANVDYSLAPNYDSGIKSKYDANFMPYWKEPVECLTDDRINEVIILKCARAGGTENLLLNRIRFNVAARPRRTLYVTGDQMSAERLMETRIKRSMKCAKSTAAAYRQAKATQHDIEFPAMDFRVTWPKSKQAFKQDGWADVLMDEVSTYPEYSTDMARKRTASYEPFQKIVIISSPDPQQKRASKDDPIFVEFNRADRRKWVCKDPKGGTFTFAMGDRQKHGLRWSESARREDGTWDFDKVRKTAHYVTPSGAVITEAKRMQVVRSGRWEATSGECPANVRSYHVNAFMSPIESMGGIAVAFLKAKAAGKAALRTFIYEYLAEEWNSDIDKVEASIIDRRIGDNLRGDLMFSEEKDRIVLMTIDVQKDHFWWLVREWTGAGESALVDWGRAISWDDCDMVAAKYQPAYIGVDAGYGQRTHEVYIECVARHMVPMKGDDKSKPGLMPFSRTIVNPHEGTRRQAENQSVPLIVFHSDTCKLMLMDRMRGDIPGWHVFRGIDRDYQLQVTAEERGPKGWVPLRRDNHAFDLETMQIVLAMSYGYCLSNAAQDDEDDQGEAGG